jgi:hypothetical protein
MVAAMTGQRNDVPRGVPSARRGRHRLALVAAGAVLLLGASAASLVGPVRAGAALPTVGGSCGFHLGTPLVTGALGTFGFEFPAFPADPHQVCSVTVTGTASLSPVTGPAYTNVAGNGGSASFTLHFTGGPLPPGIIWTWSPHCADPAAAGVVTLTIDGRSATSAVQPAGSCLPDLGGSSSLHFAYVDPSFLWYAVGLASTPDNLGYWGVTASADVHGLGNAVTPSSLLTSVAPVVGTAADPVGGVWVVAADGGVFALDGAPFFGSLGGVPLNAPVVGMTATPDGGGYWLVAADGGVFAFGDAVFQGSMGGKPLNEPVVGMAAPDAGGYWLVAADGGVFAFGDATFHGSMAGTPLNAPVVGMASAGAGGYWLAAYDGGVFALGDAPFEGSAGALSLVAPVFAISPSPTGAGYRLLAGDGGLFAYGDAGFFGPVPVP